MTMTVGKKFRFEAAHFLEGHHGACAGIHGHSYHLMVEVSSEPIDGQIGLIATGPRRAMVMDLADLKFIVQPVVDNLDHSIIVEKMVTVQIETDDGWQDYNQSRQIVLNQRPTTENLARWIWGNIENKLPSAIILERIRLDETDTQYVILEAQRSSAPPYRCLGCDTRNVVLEFKPAQTSQGVDQYANLRTLRHPIRPQKPNENGIETMNQTQQDLLKRIDNDFAYHAPHGDQIGRFAILRSEAKALAEKIIRYTPPSREQSTALTNLEQAIFWANAAIARNEKPPVVIEECADVERFDAPPVDRTQSTTTDGKPLDQNPETDQPNGQHANYKVLAAHERAKGFVRPVRNSYIHVGVDGHEIDPNNPAKHGRTGNGCGVLTRMGQALSETYARDPSYYGATFCVGCNKHLPVNEFVWADDGTVVGS